MSRIVGHLRRNAYGIIAIFIALGGTAYAIETNSVKTRHIADGHVTTADIRVAAVQSDHVLDDSLGTADVQSLQGSDLQPDTLTGAQIDERTLGQVPLAGLAGAAHASPYKLFCTPGSEAFIDCNYVRVTREGSYRALIFAEIEARAESLDGGGEGVCKLVTDQGEIPRTETYIDIKTGFEIHSVTLVGISPRMTGQHDFGIACNRREGPMNYFRPDVTVLLLPEVNS